MGELTDTALVPLGPAGCEVALPDALIERAKDYMAEALSERTREAMTPDHLTPIEDVGCAAYHDRGRAEREGRAGACRSG